MGTKVVSRQDLKHGQVAVGIALEHIVFNREHLALSTMNDLELQREVVGLFLTQLRETRDSLKAKPMAAQDRKFMSHNLRGAASAVGALQIEELARIWESVNFDPVVIDALLEQAETAFSVETRAIFA